MYSACGAAITPTSAIAGCLIRVDSKKLLVGTGQGALAVTEVQPGGKKRMSAEAFINGYKPQAGERMGDER